MAPTPVTKTLRVKDTHTTKKLLVICDPESREMILSLDYDGSAEFGENYDPDDAVRRFWEGIGSDEMLARVADAHGFELVKKA